MANSRLQQLILILVIIIPEIMTLNPCANRMENELCGTAGDKIKRCRKAPPHCEGYFCRLVCVPADSACSSNPCLHGTCEDDMLGGYFCICNPGWIGTNCDQEECDECTNSPTCNDSGAQYICTCDSWATYQVC